MQQTELPERLKRKGGIRDETNHIDLRAAGAALADVKAGFAKACGYVFEDLMGGGLGDPLTGMDEDGDFLSFMAAQSADGAVYVISWEYPAEAAEGFGARLAQAANTFELTE